ncbi:hypothetical protein L9F63_013537, partial [Diploptera punctata]
KHFTGGPILVYQAIQSTRYLPKLSFDVVDPVIKSMTTRSNCTSTVTQSLTGTLLLINSQFTRRLLNALQNSSRKPQENKSVFKNSVFRFYETLEPMRDRKVRKILIYKNFVSHGGVSVYFFSILLISC